MAAQRSSAKWHRLMACLSLLAFSLASQPAKAQYAKATEGKEVVLNKMFPKKEKVGLDLDFGGILNQSYLNTFLLHGSLQYYSSEAWGFGAEGAFALINKDKGERSCIETFFNDPDYDIPVECQIQGDKPESSRGNIGPAYVPINVFKYFIAGTATWNPVYGKQIMWLSATSYFDLFVTMGGGMAFFDHYPKETVLRNGKDSRGNFPESPSEKPTVGADPSETDLYGVNGRPDPLSKSAPFGTFGIGQRYHFAKTMSVKVEFRNYTLVGTPSGFDMMFAVWGGLGVRF